MTAIKYNQSKSTSKKTAVKKLTGEEKDGFDFIEYPCDYLFKAVCRNNTDSGIGPEQVLKDTVLQIISSNELLEVRTARSSGAKFESVSLTVRLSSREQLETLYAAISTCPIVIMTL